MAKLQQDVVTPIYCEAAIFITTTKMKILTATISEQAEVPMV